MICDVCVNKSQCTKKGIVFCAGYFLERREQTNEEWFCQLPTEEKAEWLYRVHYGGIGIGFANSSI